MTIYIDIDYKCYVSAAEGRRAIETNEFDGKCPEWIESFRFVPADETWTREDGEEFAGAEMISPWKDLGEAYAAQTVYLTGKLAAAEADIAELDIALLDAEYENITGGTDDEGSDIQSVQKDDTARGISCRYADKARCVLRRGQAKHRGIRRAVRYA